MRSARSTQANTSRGIQGAAKQATPMESATWWRPLSLCPGGSGPESGNVLPPPKFPNAAMKSCLWQHREPSPAHAPRQLAAASSSEQRPVASSRTRTQNPGPGTCHTHLETGNGTLADSAAADAVTWTARAPCHWDPAAHQPHLHTTGSTKGGSGRDTAPTLTAHLQGRLVHAHRAHYAYNHGGLHVYRAAFFFNSQLDRE
jgi:hypothetical protein